MMEAVHSRPSGSTNWLREVLTDSNGKELPTLIKVFLIHGPDNFLEVNLHRTASKLTNGVVKFIESDINDGILKMRLEFCAKGSLLDILSGQEAPIPFPQLIQWYQSMLSTISILHQNRIAHRCLDLSNWVVNSNNEVKLTDFGQAKTIKSQLTVSSYSIRGNRDYVEPGLAKMVEDAESAGWTEEEKRIEYSPFADDMWSLGKVFFEMAVRKVYAYLNTFTSQALYDKVTNELSSYGSPVLIKLVLGMMHHDPNLRLTAAQALSVMQTFNEKPELQEAFDGPCPECISTSALQLACGHKMCLKCVRQAIMDYVRIECVTCQSIEPVDDLLNKTNLSRETKYDILQLLQSSCEQRKKTWKRH